MQKRKMVNNFELVPDLEIDTKNFEDSKNTKSMQGKE